jgi:hypothetical protein
MADNGEDIKEMRLVLGHKSILSTRTDFDVTAEQADRARQVALQSRM